MTLSLKSGITRPVYLCSPLSMRVFYQQGVFLAARLSYNGGHRNRTRVNHRNEGMAAMAALERAVVIVLDGVGVGQAPDVASYGDTGANCLTNCAEAVGGLSLPVMGRMGIGNVTPIRGVPPIAEAAGAYGRLVERAAGKDSTTGHWELMGVTLEHPLPTYPPGFPADLVPRVGVG